MLTDANKLSVERQLARFIDVRCNHVMPKSYVIHKVNIKLYISTTTDHYHSSIHTYAHLCIEICIFTQRHTHTHTPTHRHTDLYSLDLTHIHACECFCFEDGVHACTRF